MTPPTSKKASAPSSILAAAIGLSSLGSQEPPVKPSNDAAQSNLIHSTTTMPPTPTCAGHFMDPRGLPLMPSQAGFGTMMHPTMPCANPLPIPPLSSAAATMDRHVMVDRVTAVNRAVALAPGTRPSLYGPYNPYHHHHSPQGMMMMPHATLPHTTPLQITPIPNTKNFPETLFDVVSAPEHVHIISWLPHGKGFIIHDKQRFAAMILPRYFDGAKFTSFTRRLKRWSFVRTPRGPELGAYYNKNFVRGMPELVQEMRYRMDGQFQEAKGRSIIGKDGKECSEQGKKLNEEPKKEDETKAKETKAKVQDSHSKNEERRLSSKITSPEIKPTYMANSQFRDPYSVGQAIPSNNVHQRVANTAPSQFVGKHRPRALTESSLMTPPSPAIVSVSPNDHTQREMRLARTAMSHVAGMGLTPGPAGGARARSVATSRHQGLPYHTDPVAPRGAINAQSARLLLESERAALGRAVPGGSFPADRYRPQDDGRFRGEARDVAPRSMQARMVHPFVDYPERPEGSSINPPPARHSRGGPYYEGKQPVMMSRQEETEFADYLSMKRESANVRQWP